MELILDILLDTFEDVLKIIPFLFIIYLILEWMEQEAGHKMERFLEKHRRLNPLAGTIFGLLPSCGFAGAASSLYATGVISAGTLVAVYLSSSDEMLSIMLSKQTPFHVIAPILGVKLIVGLTAGYLLDLFSRHNMIHVNEFCEAEHDDHSHGILYSSVMHTIQVTIWLFVITFIFNGIVSLIGEETLYNFIISHPNKSVLVSSLVGMIPSCASSILLTTMYLESVITFPAVCAGLLVNAGSGMLILFRVNRNMKDNMMILFVTWICGLAAGFILETISMLML